MADNTVPGLGDLLALFGGANPFATIGKTIEQFKRGVNDFLGAVENFNKTMETMNEVATRVNRLVDDVEEPIRALMPQVTRSIKAADAIFVQLSGPVERVAPGLSRLAETLSSPVLANMPTDLGIFLETLGDLSRRLQPLTQLAESAGSMFGLRPLNVLRGGGGRPPAPAPAPAPPPPTPSVGHAAPAAAAPRKAAPKKGAAKKAAPKKTAAKKSR